MHEVSICRGLVEQILSVLDEQGVDGGSLVEAKVVVGGLRQVIPESMQQAYAVLTADTSIAGSKLNLQILPIQAKCLACGTTGIMERWEFRCPKCGADTGRPVGAWNSSWRR